MLLSLAGCKDDAEVITEPEEEQEVTGQDEDEEDVPVPEEEEEYYHSELAKTGVYDITDIDLGFGDADVYVVNGGINDDGAYFIACESDEFYNHAYYLCTFDDKGKMLDKVHLSLPVKTEKSYDEKTDVMVINEETSGIVYDSPEALFKENKIKFDEIDTVYYENFNYAGDGLYEAIIKAYVGEWESTYLEAFNVRWNEDGECVDILYLPVDCGEGYVDDFVYAPDGTLSIVYNYYKWDDDINGERAVVYSADRFDNPDNMIVAENEDLSVWASFLGSFVKCGNRLMAVYDAADNEGKTTVAEIDLDTFEPVDPFVLNQLGSGTIYPLGATKDGQFIFSTRSGLQTCKNGEKASILLDDINSDLRENGFGCFASINGSDEFYLSYTSTDGKTYVAFCKAVAPEDVEDCNVITYAATDLYGGIVDLIVDYNEKNTGTRIVFRDYSLYEKRDDYEYDKKKLYEDMKTGSMADIVFLDPYENFDLDSLAAKGVFADIGALIEEDPDMDMDDYLTNIFDALSFEGKMYRITPSFSVYSVYGSSEFVSGYENWDVDTFLEYSDSLDPEESIMFTMFETRSNFLEDLLKYDGYCWVDRNKFTCDFNDPSFVRLLAYAQTIPEYIDYDSVHMSNYWNDSYKMYASGEIRVSTSYMADFKEGFTDAYANCQSEPVFVGFPSPDSQGSVITYYNTYLLKADSPLLDDSWVFIKQVLQSSFQNSDKIVNIPVLKSAFEEKMADCANPFTSTNEAGEEYDFMPSYYSDGDWLDVPVMTSEQIEYGKEMICSIDRACFEDQELMELILDEINSGFNSGETPEQIASDIQLAVQEVLDQRKAG